MNPWVAGLVGVLSGVGLGMILASLMVAAKQADEEIVDLVRRRWPHHGEQEIDQLLEQRRVNALKAGARRES